MVNTKDIPVREAASGNILIFFYSKIRHRSVQDIPILLQLTILILK
jgi:hypothetical protein